MGRHTGVVATGLLIVLTLFGCGSEYIATNTEAGEDQKNGGTSAPETYVVVPAGAKSLDVQVGKRVPLKVYLLEKTTGEAVSGKSLSYEVVSGGDLGSLDTRNVETGEQGGASVNFRAGHSSGDAFVQVEHPKAGLLEFRVAVHAKPSGGIRVELVNTGKTVMPLQDITVRLYETDELECSQYAPLGSEREEPMRTAMRESTGRTVEFGGLSSDRPYTVTAVARGDRGQVAAGGCQENIQVPADRITEKQLLLQLVPLNPTGRFYTTSHYDFSNALEDSGVVGENIVRVLDLFENPGAAIYDEVINLIENLVGNLAASAFETLLNQTGLDQQFKQMINQAIQGNDTLCKIREIGRDVRDVVASLEVDSELTIGRLGSDYEFRGRDNWLNVTMYWRAKCDGAIEKVCSQDEDDGTAEDRKRPCAAIHLVPKQNENDVGDIGVWSSEWTGRLTSYNQLQVERHPLPVRYGKLIQFVLKDVVIPALTDGAAGSLAEAFSHWLGCDALAQSVTGGDGEVCALDQCIQADDISSSCEAAVGTVFAAAGLAISELQFDTGIHVGGEATLVETTSDARVDYIEDGIWEGYIEVSDSGNSGGRSDISGAWSAERTSTDVIGE